MKKALAPASKQTQGQPMWGRGHCTTALFFLQGEAAPCKASPFTAKPARVGKPSPRRSPWWIFAHQREGGSGSRPLCFFMRTVSHTFPAYNGNEMPPWYTIVFFVYGRVVDKPRCLQSLFYGGTFGQLCARVHERISPQCPGTPRVKPHKKSRLFSDWGAKSFFMVSVSQRKETEFAYFPPQNLRLFAGRSNHSGFFRWKNLPGIPRLSA